MPCQVLNSYDRTFTQYYLANSTEHSGGPIQHPAVRKELEAQTQGYSLLWNLFWNKADLGLTKKDGHGIADIMKATP